MGPSYYSQGGDQKIILGLEKVARNLLRIDVLIGNIYHGDPARRVEYLCRFFSTVWRSG